MGTMRDGGGERSWGEVVVFAWFAEGECFSTWMKGSVTKGELGFEKRMIT